MKTKLTDTPDYSKTLDFNHHDLVHDIAIFTAHTLCRCCFCVISSRRTFSRVKVRQAVTSYLLVHLTNSTTLTAYIQWYTTRRFRNFLLFTSLEDSLPRSPTHCRRAVVTGFKDTSSLNQPPATPRTTTSYLETILYSLRHMRTARLLVSPSLHPCWWWCISGER